MNLSMGSLKNTPTYQAVQLVEDIEAGEPVAIPEDRTAPHLVRVLTIEVYNFSCSVCVSPRNSYRSILDHKPLDIESQRASICGDGSPIQTFSSGA